MTDQSQQQQEQTQQQPLDQSVPLDSILNPTGKDSDRLTLFPIRHKDLWELFKKAEACFWTADELKLAKDIKDWQTQLNQQEREYIEHILAFFAGSDGIVIENLLQRFANEVQYPEARAFYAFQGYIETVHCVSGDTRIFTDKGYMEIGRNENKTVNVWNGHEFSEVVIKKTGDSAPLTLVKLSNGMTLKCTSKHKWFLRSSEAPVYTQDLRIGDVLLPWKYTQLPDMPGSKSMDSPYTFGYVFGQRYRLDKSMSLIVHPSHLVDLDFVSCDLRGDKYFARVKRRYYGSDDYVPYNFDTKSRTRWLQGVWDSCGTYDESDHRYYFKIRSSSCARNLQLLLTTLNVFSINHGRHVSVSQLGAQLLCRRGVYLCDEQEDDQEVEGALDGEITVTGLVADQDGATFCFTEPKRHAGVFNGILTGQSETYSLFIDTLVKDEQRQKYLLEGIENIPAIRKKADWAMKWIASQEANFGERLFAFACVEGVFFSGSFAAIYWLKSRGIMKTLSWANDKIMSDEGLHTLFACQIIRDHLKHQRPSEARVREIMKEAVDIEVEFQTESFPCPFPEFNADRMAQYIRHVADKVLELAGYRTMYNVTNPFPFMETMALRTATNQFERDNPSYRIPQGSKAFELTDDF